MRAAVVFALLLFACGPGNPGGPSMNNNMSSDQPAPDIQSNDILGRDAQSNHTAVKHILIGWRDLAGGRDIDSRAKTRTRQQADHLAQSLLERVRKGEPIEPLMAEFSEDGGSAESGESYEVTPDAKLVFEFKRLGLRLKPGEAGLVLSQFGWHIMKRVE
jgi:parvulin-like peptidyl-prolyl cis-trans isomerase-like protein